MSKHSLLALALCGFLAPAPASANEHSSEHEALHDSGYKAPMAQEPTETPHRSASLGVSAENSLCGVMESFSGDVQILDPTRSTTLTLQMRTAIPCGAWVASNQGWAQIRHASNTMVHLGKDTLVQLPNVKPSEDSLVLYKGHLYVQAGGGGGEFSLVSATGRVRVKRGKILVNFSDQADRTQLIGLEDQATLENRFESSRKVVVKAGEMTELDLNLERVIPILPKPVSLAALEPQMNELKVSHLDQALGEKAALARKLASTGAGAEHKEHLVKPSMPAAETYMRERTLDDNPDLKSHWMRSIAGGSDQGEKIINQDTSSSQIQRAKIEVEEVDKKLKSRISSKEKLERDRILKELSQIKTE